MRSPCIVYLRSIQSLFTIIRPFSNFSHGNTSAGIRGLTMAKANPLDCFGKQKQKNLSNGSNDPMRRKKVLLRIARNRAHGTLKAYLYRKRGSPQGEKLRIVFSISRSVQR